MITFDYALKKASDYLNNGDIPVVITLIGRFSEGGAFVFNPENILKREIIVRYLQEIRHL